GLSIEYHSSLFKPLRSGLSKLLRSGLSRPLRSEDKMVEENVPAPTRTDEQLVPVKQFWNTLAKVNKTGVYSFQLDELWLNLNVDLLCNAFRITPKDSGIVTGTNVDYVELIWEEFIQKIKNFFSDMANLKILTKKPKSLVILYCRFTKLTIYYLGSRHNIHRRPWSHVHITVNDYPLNYLKFVSKGEVDEVFGMPIPKDLITDAIWNSDYYKKYLEMAAHKPRQPTTMTGEEVGKKKKALQADKEGQPASEPQVEDDEYNLQRVITRKLPDVEGNGKGIVTDEQYVQSLLDLQKPKEQSIKDQYIFQRRTLVTHDASIGPSTQPQDDTFVNVILNVVEEQGEEVSNTVALEETTIELDEGQARSDLGKTSESQAPPEIELMKEDLAGSNPKQRHMAQAGQNPEPMHEDFNATVYHVVHENLKLTTEEHVYIENPPSSSGTLSLMKNLEDPFTFGDQFLNDKSTEEEPGKANVENEVESMVTVPIH
ncbi:hypothetical protein Tco_0550767, partial [Tanacetum coccineum]